MHRHQGFTLVELSIVLVILGLLAGGVIAGQNLLHTASLNKAMQEKGGYVSAVKLFVERYESLPGDMHNATGFWGYADTSGVGGICGAPLTDTGTDTQTCNGDGDSTLESLASTVVYEWFRFWQHLHNAELINEKLSGIRGASGAMQAEIGENVPKSVIDAGGWTAFYLPIQSGSAYFDGAYGNSLILGAEESNEETNAVLLTPEDAYLIDNKLDDGKPGTGKVIGYNWDDCTDATDETAISAEYLLSVSNKACALVFPHAFDD